MTPDYSIEENRAKAWQALARVPEFHSFFLGHYIPERVKAIEAALIESTPPDDVPAVRKLRTELKALVTDARNAVKKSP